MLSSRVFCEKHLEKSLLCFAIVAVEVWIKHLLSHSEVIEGRWILSIFMSSLSCLRSYHQFKLLDLTIR